MDLIKELGLEKCKQIVDGAPAIANFYIPSKAGYTRMWSVLLDGAISLNDLRTALADHEKCQHEWNETTSNGDAYRFFVCKHCDSTQNYVPFETDNCTDIKNHISPNTKVIEK